MKYIGKCLMLEEDGERVLVIGDLHLGYEEALHANGISVGNKLFKENLDELEKIFEISGKVDKVVLIGDIKHQFYGNSNQEWREVSELIDFLKKYCKEIILLKGNHDNYLSQITGKKELFVKPYFIWKGNCFIHGDSDYLEIHAKEVKRWIMGHIHPALMLSEGAKREKYKCFLIGKYEKKEIIILPSFFSGIVGSDVRERSVSIPWEFEFDKFKAVIIEGLDTYEFGIIGKL